MSRADRIWDALGRREPVLTYIALQIHRDPTVDPNGAGLRRILRTVNVSRRRVRQIAPRN